MSKKNDSKITYFFGGTAVGIAAGLVVGKLFSNSSTVQTQNIGSKPSRNENVIKYSQDDNIHNLYFHKDIHSCHTRSKSASRYESKSCKEQSVSEAALTKLNDFKDNINNLASEEKYSSNVQKIVYNTNNQLYNISIENNVEYNLSTEITSDYKEEKIYNTNHLPESKNLEKESSNTAQSESNGFINIEDKNVSKVTNIENMTHSNKKSILKRTKRSNSTELTEMLINLPNNSRSDDIIVHNNLPKIRNSVINLSTLQNHIEIASNMATYNSTSEFDNEEEVLYLTNIDGFYETDLISSTRENNSNDT